MAAADSEFAHGAEAAAEASVDPAAYIMHHVQDGYDWELPTTESIAGHVDLRDIFGQWIVNVGGYQLDLTPTRLTVVMWIAAILITAGLLLAVRNRGPVPKGRWANLVETLFLFVRDEVAAKNIGHGSEKYVPYLASVFFFILTMNLLSLLPFSATATGSVYVTGVLAAFTFVMTQIAGMRAQGVVGYWTHLVPSGVPWWLYPLLLPIEIIGLFTKPFALMMRLFANMVAGHIIIFFLLGLIFFMKTVAVAPIAVPFAFGIYLLELLVCFIQAYVFTILSAVFIGLASHAH